MKYLFALWTIVLSGSCYSQEESNARDNSLTPVTTEFKPGYFCSFEHGVSLGLTGHNRFSANVINGYRVSPFFSVGLGIGYRPYLIETRAYVPVFLSLRANFIDGPVTPYFELAGGYSFNPDKSTPWNLPGAMICPSSGIRFALSHAQNVRMHIGITYEIQWMDVERSEGDGPWRNRKITRTFEPTPSIGLMIGLTFGSRRN